MSGVELAACPFCGSAPKIEDYHGTSIVCSNDQCIIWTPQPLPFNDFGHRAAAIAAWNRRAVPMEAETSMAAARLSDLLRADHLTGDYPIAGMGSVSWDDLRAILQALALIPQAEDQEV